MLENINIGDIVTIDREACENVGFSLEDLALTISKIEEGNVTLVAGNLEWCLPLYKGLEILKPYKTKKK